MFTRIEKNDSGKRSQEVRKASIMDSILTGANGTSYGPKKCRKDGEGKREGVRRLLESRRILILYSFQLERVACLMQEADGRLDV